MWLDVGEDISIVAGKVVAIEALNDLNSNVYTDGRTFKVNMPKATLMQMIESRISGGNDNIAVLLQEILKGQSQPRP